MVKITFPNGDSQEFPDGTTGLDIANKISPRLANEALGMKMNGVVKDVFLPVTEDAHIQILTWKDEEGKNIFRHSTTHLMAQAIVRMYPDVKLTIGPVVEEGFYYDIDSDRTFSPEDFQSIEAEMQKIVNENFMVSRQELMKKDALKLFAANDYKVEMINEMDGDETTISVYKQGEFMDLCRGPHVPKTGLLKSFKLTKVAGAYWRGKSENKQLQRIYGISFPEKKMLDAHLEMLKQAEERDHRKLGKELELVMFHEYSPGSPFFYHKGAIIYNELLAFIRREYFRRGYKEVITPLLYDKDLWETSGHWEHYKNDMFLLNIDGKEFSLKPMNCPSHVLMFKSLARSYRDLPLRIADFAPLHRNELKGVLSGMTRVRKFSQDDSHTFVTEQQIENEVISLIDFVKYVYEDVFKFEYKLFLSTRPESFMGDIELWNKAEALLEDVLRRKEISYQVNKGDGAFYGPKIDIRIKDALGREWQLATIQLDFQMPLRFGATYEGQDGKKHTPIMIHKAILGSLERFIGIMIEHYAGKFPLWISPVQVKILPIADRHMDYAYSLKRMLEQHMIRVEIDERVESIPKKVRDAQLERVPLMLTVGDKELENGTVAARTLDGKVKFGVSKEDILEKILCVINSKAIGIEL
jgi:threonyl-tRNA synthetase